MTASSGPAHSVNGQYLDIIGKLMTEISLGKQVWQQEFEVLKGAYQPVILDWCFLEKHHALLDLRNKVLQLWDMKIPLCIETLIVACVSVAVTASPNRLLWCSHAQSIQWHHHSRLTQWSWKWHNCCSSIQCPQRWHWATFWSTPWWVSCCVICWHYISWHCMKWIFVSMRHCGLTWNFRFATARSNLQATPKTAKNCRKLMWALLGSCPPMTPLPLIPGEALTCKWKCCELYKCKSG